MVILRIAQKTSGEVGYPEDGRLETKRNREGLSMETSVAIGGNNEKSRMSTDLLERILA
jgi:hypothetical protein